MDILSEERKLDVNTFLNIIFKKILIFEENYKNQFLTIRKIKIVHTNQPFFIFLKERCITVIPIKQAKINCSGSNTFGDITYIIV